MSLLETLRQDHKSARLARDEIRANLLGTLIGGIESEQKSEKQADRPLDDRQITAAISSCPRTRSRPSPKHGRQKRKAPSWRRSEPPIPISMTVRRLRPSLTACWDHEP